MIQKDNLQDNNQNQTLYQIKDNQVNSFELIPEQLIMQNLTHFFLSPTTKSLPYSTYFNEHPKWFIYSLAYLYSFIRTTYQNNHTNKIFQKMIIKNAQISKQTITHIISQLAQSQQTTISCNRKVLLTRYMSVPSCIAQHLTKSRISIPTVQTAIISEVCNCLTRLNLDEQVFIVNKIIMLTYGWVLVQRCLHNQGSLAAIKQLYSYIVRKDTMLSTILKYILQDNSQSIDKTIVQKQLKQIIQNNHNTGAQNHTQIISLLHQQYLQPHHATKIYQILLKNNQSLKTSVLQDLLVWWTQSNDHYFIYNMIKFRTNLLAIIMLNLDKMKLVEYSALLSYGIQRRLMNVNQNRKQVVNLVWSVLADKMGFQLPKEFNQQLLKSDAVQQQIKQQKHIQKQQCKQNKNIPMQQVDQQQYMNAKENKNEQNDQIKPKPPRNLYDCILGLQNPARKSITLQLMPKIIRRNPDDIVFVWRDLIQNLMYNLNQQTKPSIVALFITRPEGFVQSISQVFFGKDHSLNDKIILIQALSQGVQQLSTKPITPDQQSPRQQFYFKKVTSKYFNDKDINKNNKLLQEKDESRSRRWGYTRIAHEKKLKQKQSGIVSLRIVDNQPYINRLYQISNQLFFRIISKLTLLPIFPKQPMFTAPLMKLLATLSYNLKNHIQKYKILTQIVDICLFVIEYMEGLSKKQKTEQFLKSAVKWKNANLSILNTLNKISLVIDKFIPVRMLQTLQKCTTKLKNSKQYGINPIINMIQANIYTNVSGGKINF